MGLPPSFRDHSKALNQSNKWLPKRRVWIYALRVSAALIIAFVLSLLKVDYIEAFLYDLRTVYSPKSKLSDKIVIVLTDSKTVEKLKAVPGLVEHTVVLEKLKLAQPRSTVYVTAIAPIMNVESERSLRESKDAGFLKGSETDQKHFMAVASRLPGLMAVTDELEFKTEQGNIQLTPPFHDIQLVPGPRNSDKFILAKDGVTRRILISYQDQILMHPRLATQYIRELKDLKNIRGLVTLFDSEQVYIKYHKPGAFKVIKFEDLFSGNFKQADLSDKIVLIGDDLGQSIKDYIATPFNRSLNDMTITEMHAHMIETLITNSAPQHSPDWMSIFLTVIVAIWTIHVVMSLRPLRGLYVLLSTAAGVLLVGYISFWPLGFWLKIGHPLLAIFLCYYFFIPYRLIIENRRSWEYFERNKLLSQVEELKTNFISMMSHDLKTPIARIQGMTEAIANDANSLSLKQREALDLIGSSSTDLLNFINSILNYATIESKGVELHLETKDVNQILEDVIHKFDFHAKLKHIQIKQDLEPLFSIPIDPQLIKQVFSNLVENAIKYSPDSSPIEVQSREEGGNVIVQIKDVGPGIPKDDLENIFMKFFRSKNAKTSPIKGSGLGLFLAKYFVELHKGQLYVRSTLGQGSVFVVELPLGGPK